MSEDRRNEAGEASSGFLERWSRRKQDARKAAVEPAAGAPAPLPKPAGPDVPVQSATAAPAAGGPGGAPAAGEPGTSELDELLKSLPRIEDLTADSDVSVFLRQGVPLELQRRALRAAWTLDPAIRDFVEVAENQWDWNVPGGVPGSGELAPGTSIEDLLAQATGRGSLPPAGGAPAQSQPAPSPASAPSGEPGPRPPDPVRRSEPDTSGPSAAQAEPAPDADRAADRASDQAARDGATGAAPAAARDGEGGQGTAAPRSAASEITTPPARRRHGGALPG